jgi:aspartate racemase
MEELGQLLQDSQVTVLWLTANLFQHMVERQRASLRQLRQLLAGGDVLSAPHVRQALQEMIAGALINGYGPTENTTFTCCYPVTPTSQVGQSVPIGRPIANTQVYVLDRALQPVPVGVPGELYTGGDGLARGYFNRPELTAERFIPHPYSTTPGARLYKTGDLVRYRADSTLEFLGRLDHQVKVRGFRIEPGEIEAVLGQHPKVREAVVVAREETPGEKRLVAYVVMHQSCEQTSGELRRFLQGKLPAYMVPSAFMVLEALPLTTNGKTDRLALPDPTYHQARDNVFIAPRMPLEEQLATLWATLLNVSPISVHDDFFALGGHSLLATQMVSRLRDAYQVEIPLRCLFEAPTVAGLAEVIETIRWARRESQAACETPLSDREEGEI